MGTRSTSGKTDSLVARTTSSVVGPRTFVWDMGMCGVNGVGYLSRVRPACPRRMHTRGRPVGSPATAARHQRPPLPPPPTPPRDRPPPPDRHRQAGRPSDPPPSLSAPVRPPLPPPPPRATVGPGAPYFSSTAEIRPKRGRPPKQPPPQTARTPPQPHHPSASPPPRHSARCCCTSRRHSARRPSWFPPPPPRGGCVAPAAGWRKVPRATAQTPPPRSRLPQAVAGRLS